MVLLAPPSLAVQTNLPQIGMLSLVTLSSHALMSWKPKLPSFRDIFLASSLSIAADGMGTAINE